MRKIQMNQAIPPAQKMKYLGEWRTAKASGKLPEAGEVVTENMSMVAVLKFMARRAQAALGDGTLHPKWGVAVDHLDSRQFWLVPASETPSCEVGKTGVAVRHLAAIRIPLA